MVREEGRGAFVKDGRGGEEHEDMGWKGRIHIVGQGAHCFRLKIYTQPGVFSDLGELHELRIG